MLPWFYFLKEDEQLLVESFTDRFTVEGPRVYLAMPFHSVTRRRGMTLSPTEYVRIKNIMTGELKNVVGPQIYFLSAQESIEKLLTAIPLKHHQYVRLLDHRTGKMRVERGEKTVLLEPTEEVIGKVSEGINLDEHTGMLLRDTMSGSLELITQKKVFFPRADQEIVEIREKIRLESHQMVVIKDKDGNFLFRRGTDKENAFFLEPYCELVSMRWSTGIHKDRRDLTITHFDLRPKFMWFEFEARTQDNVELAIGITFFWQVADLEAMFKTTDDTPGDICAHARSIIIQAVCQVTLENFLSSFNTVVKKAVLDANDPFYAERGVKLHSVEVRSIVCKNPETQQILQEIIQETTNRINRIQKQESENEIRIKQIKGEIEAEQMKSELLKIRQEHMKTEARMEGEAQAERVHCFLDGLGKDLSGSEKISLFNTLKKTETLGDLARGSAHLYFTPADVDLSIEARNPVGLFAPPAKPEATPRSPKGKGV